MTFDLEQLRNDSADALGWAMREFNPDADEAGLLAAHREVTQRLLIVAAAALLVDGAADRFRLNLIRCAENGRRFLKLMRRRGVELPSASRNTALVAALAAGDAARAAQLAALSRDTPDRGSGEYEDEFLWARVLQLLAAQPSASSDSVATVIDQLLEEAPDEYETRAAIVTALLEKDGKAFSQAIVSGAREYGRKTEKRARSFGTPVTEFAPHRFLWFDGLALLRLGERAGLEVSADVPYCPALARAEPKVSYEGDWAIETGVAADRSLES